MSTQSTPDAGTPDAGAPEASAPEASASVEAPSRPEPEPRPSSSRAQATPTRAAELTRALTRSLPDVLPVLALLVLFWVVHRFAEEVEYGGDAVEKWNFARQWSYANDFQGKWTHHMTRMGVNAFSWLIQKLFGRSWHSYAYGPFFMAALQVPFIYATARKLAGRWAGVLGVLLIMYLPMVHRSASQVLPDGYAGTWGIISAYLFFRWADAPARTERLIAIAVGCFIGYLTKETFFFFFPGFVLAIWLERRRLRDVALYLGAMLAGFVLETAAYAVFTPFSSRWAAIHSTHGAGDDWTEVGFWDLFKHFHELHDGSKYLMFFAFAAGLWLITFPRENHSHGRGLALICFSQILGVTFVVRDINPIKIFQGFDPRYLEPATPFLGALAGTYLAVVLAAGFDAARRAWGESWLPSGSSGPWYQSALATLLVAAIAVTTYRTQKRYPPLDGYARGLEIATLANDTYARNLPLVESGGRAKVLTAIYDVYLDDRKLARRGILPNFDEVSGRHGRYTYLLQNPKVYRKGTLQQLMDEGCYMELDNGSARNPHTRDRRSSIRIAHPSELLPPRCDALLAELTKR
jgi:hypothetical protein